MKRTLPVYFIIDTSGSMHGESIQAVNNNVKLFVRTLRKDPFAIETVKVCFIEYNNSANVVMPMTELTQVQEPVFTAGGSTCLGAGLDLLAKCLNHDVKIGDPGNEIKGDWKPLVFHLTDGYPNDDWEDALGRFDRKSVNFIVSCGVPGADRSVLEKVSEDPKYVIELESATEEDLKKYFEWVTQSIEYAAKRVQISPDPEVDDDVLPAFEHSEPDEFF